MKVTVYFSPGDVKAGVIQKATVVLADILRMTTTVAAYLHHGAAAVAPFSEPASAKAAFSKLKRGEGLLAGETHWEKVAGFPLSGSPLDSSRERVKGRTVCFSSRSVTALKSLKNASTLLLGSFVNLSDVYDTVLRLKKDVVIVCGISEQGTSPEDATFAGTLADFLQNTVGGEPLTLAESARKAITQYKPWQGRLLELLRGSPEGKELVRKGFDKDLNYCAKISRLDGVPVLRNGLFVRESAPRPRMKLSGLFKLESGAPSKGKAIKVHVPLFPKNPEHPTPDLQPKKKTMVPAGKSAVPSGKGQAPKSSSGPGAGAKQPAVPSKAPSGAAKGPSKPTPAGTPSPKAGSQGSKGAPGGLKPAPRKTPLFSKRTVAVPAILKPMDPGEAVTQAMDALKTSLAHLRTKQQAANAPSRGKADAKAGKTRPKPPSRTAKKRK